MNAEVNHLLRGSTLEECGAMYRVDQTFYMVLYSIEKFMHLKLWSVSRLGGKNGTTIINDDLLRDFVLPVLTTLGSLR